MSAYEVKDEFIHALRKGEAHFYLVNFANPDMVGHTGDFTATVEAIQTVDKCLGEIAEVLEEEGISFIITADHGNAEEMIGSHSEPLTMHSTNPVPLILSLPKETKLREGGILSDIAPTILKLLDIEIPKEYTGKSLF
jgi:2,3-bisphosphoglycerate-independent phosphoglycerate mutase